MTNGSRSVLIQLRRLEAGTSHIIRDADLSDATRVTVRIAAAPDCGADS